MGSTFFNEMQHFQSRNGSRSQLASFGGWQEGVYRDLLALQAGAMTIEAFDARYLRHEAILALIRDS